MKQNIKIKIAGDEYQLAVDPDLEEGIRAAADRINENVDYLLDHYGNVSPKQVLGIVLLREEVKLIELQRKNAGEAGEMDRELEALNAELDEYLLSR